MSIVSARDISKAFDAKVLFSHVSITIAPGERVGVVGRNGSGKSTLLKILAGLERPDDGIVERQRDARIRYLAQEPQFAPGSTARQIVGAGLAEWSAKKHAYDALSERLLSADDPALLMQQAALVADIERLGGWTRDHEVDDMLGRLGVDARDRDVAGMSGGERRRVALAALLVEAPTLAILDEPTNHLDADTIEWLETYLAESFSGAVLVVTHDRYVLDAICTRMVELDARALNSYAGNYGDFLEQKAERLAHDARVEQNRLNLLRRETEWLRRGPKARTTKQKARIQRAEALIAQKPEQKAASLMLEASAVRMGGTILELEDVGFDVPGDARSDRDDVSRSGSLLSAPAADAARGPARSDSAPRTLFDHLTLHMAKGSRIGVIGKNGVGKTSLLRLITGEATPTRGRITRGQNTKLAYIDQARAELVDAWSVFDNVAERQGALKTGGISVQVGALTLPLRQYLERFAFDAQAQRQPVGALSGGERARVTLAKALKTQANLLLLDEPTNDLDTLVLGALEELLESWPGCALIVSHDRYFLNRLATSLLVFENGGVTHYAGNYDTYRALRSEGRVASAEPTPVPAADAARGPVRSDRDGVSRSGSLVSAPAAADAARGPVRSDRDGVSRSGSLVSAPAADAARGPAPSNGASAQRRLTFAERKELDAIMPNIEALEARVQALERELADPTLYVQRHTEVKGLQARLAEEKRALEALVARWELLERMK